MHLLCAHFDGQMLCVRIVIVKKLSELCEERKRERVKGNNGVVGGDDKGGAAEGK